MTHSPEGMNHLEAGLIKLRTAVVLSGVAIMAVIGLKIASDAGLDLPIPNPMDLFDNGHDGDDSAHGTLRVEEQTPRTATDSFSRVEIGQGTATVAVKAHRNWDKPGGFFSGDMQSTNGTADVNDPEDSGQPAHIEVGVHYCADGAVSRTTTADVPAEEGGDHSDDIITLDMNQIFICGVEWLPTPENEAAFGQDDTPPGFQGAFESLIKDATTAAVAASACPSSVIDAYTSDAYIGYAERTLSVEEDVPVRNVTVTPGVRGHTSPETQDMLRRGLQGFTGNNEIDIDYFSGDGAAITDSCFVDTSGVPLSSIDQLTVPQP